MNSVQLMLQKQDEKPSNLYDLLPESKKSSPESGPKVTKKNDKLESLSVMAFNPQKVK